MMDAIPTELLSMILTMYISNSDQDDAVRLRELQNRILTASLVSKSWNKVLSDNLHDSSVHTVMDVNEVAHVVCSRSSSLAERLFSRVGGLHVKDMPGEASSSSSSSVDDYREVLPKILQGIRVISTFAHHISYLNVELPEGCRNISSFDCSILEAFPRLKELHLKKFKTIENLKYHFPEHIKRLYIEYGEIWMRNNLHSHSISIFDLPPHAHLDFCRIQKPGTLGVISRQIMEQITECEIDSLFLLMSVAVDDPELVDMFQKPYKEGAYVPPHILGDWEVVEMSHRATDRACTILLESLQTSPTLQTLAISGEASQSVKIVPSVAMKESEDLSWISSITEQASSLLYGMSGEELSHRLDLLHVMNVRESLPHNLHLVLSGESEDFRFVVRIDS